MDVVVHQLQGLFELRHHALPSHLHGVELAVLLGGNPVRLLDGPLDGLFHARAALDHVDGPLCASDIQIRLARRLGGDYLGQLRGLVRVESGHRLAVGVRHLVGRYHADGLLRELEQGDAVVDEARRLANLPRQVGHRPIAVLCDVGAERLGLVYDAHVLALHVLDERNLERLGVVSLYHRAWDRLEAEFCAGYEASFSSDYLVEAATCRSSLAGLFVAELPNQKWL